MNSGHNSLAENNSVIRTEGPFVPDIAFFNEENEKVFLDQFEGKTILLVFWASWCGSCIEELPSLDTLQKDFRKLAFEVVAISEDFGGIKAVRDHFVKYGIRHLTLYHDYRNALFKGMSIAGLPTAYLVDPDGKIKMIFKGNIKWHDDEIRDIILAEIPGNPQVPKNSYIKNSLNKPVAPLADKPVTKLSKPEEKEKTKDSNNNEKNNQNGSNK